MPGRESWDVFISYALKEDAEHASWFRSQLGHHSWRCFAAGYDLHLQVGSADWSEAIDYMLERTPALLLLASTEALLSRWVNYEWRSVHDSILSGQSRLLIPVCIRGPGPSELPLALRRRQCVDCRDASTRDSQLGKIVELLKGFVAAPISSMSDQDPRVRTQAARSLLLRGDFDAIRPSPKAEPALEGEVAEALDGSVNIDHVRWFLHSTDRLVREYAVSALRGRPEAEEECIRILRDDDALYTRIAAAEILAKIHTPRSQECLTATLAHATGFRDG